MLSIAKVSGSDYGGYLLTEGADQYYRMESPGLWLGEGARALGLQGEIKENEFKCLLAGFSPDGKTSLTQNAGAPGRQCGWDLTFNVPKSVSVAWAVGEQVVQRRIERSIRHAVVKELRNIERECGVSRRGSTGRLHEPAKLAVAVVPHQVSRDGDPHLHIHAVIMNVGVRPDQTTGTIVSRPFYKRKMASGRAFRENLARNLERFGVPLIRKGSGFEIEGISQTVCRTFSKRRQDIEALLKVRGENSAIASRAATLATRKRKRKVAKSVLEQGWKQEAKAFGLTPQKVQDLFGQTRRNTPPKDSVDESRGWNSHIRLFRLLSEALLEAQLGSSLKPAAKLILVRGAKRQQKWRSRNHALRHFGRTLFRIPLTKWELRWVYERPLWKWPITRKMLVPRLALARAGKPIWNVTKPQVVFQYGPLQVRKERLFPKAPDWSKAANLTVPKVRIRPPIEMLADYWKRKKAEQEQKPYQDYERTLTR